MTGNLSYCADQIKQHDPDRFLVTLFARADAREALFGLYTLNLELARTRQVVKEIPTGQIRLQWWADEIEKLYAGQVSDHPVLATLQGDIGRLPFAHFSNLIDAWEEDLYTDQFKDITDLKARIEALSLPVFELAATIEGRNYPALRDLVLCWGLTQFIRALPLYRQRGRAILPDTLTVRAIWDEAMQALSRCPKDRKSHLSGYRYLSKRYLREIERLKFEPEAINLEKRPFGAEIGLALSYFF